MLGPAPTAEAPRPPLPFFHPSRTRSPRVLRAQPVPPKARGLFAIHTRALRHHSQPPFPSASFPPLGLVVKLVQPSRRLARLLPFLARPPQGLPYYPP